VPEKKSAEYTKIYTYKRLYPGHWSLMHTVSGLGWGWGGGQLEHTTNKLGSHSSFS